MLFTLSRQLVFPINPGQGRVISKLCYIVCCDDLVTFGSDLQLRGGLDAGHGVGGDALVHAGIRGHEAEDAEARAADNLRREERL